MTTHKYYFNLYNDYRSGPSLHVYDSDDENCNEYLKSEATVVAELQLPVEKKYVSYIILDYIGDYDVLAKHEFKTLKHAKNYLLQAYCKANKCTPFDEDKDSYGPMIIDQGC